MLKARSFYEYCAIRSVRDRIVEITPLGEQPTFDVTVEGTHNFIADGVVVHNSSSKTQTW